MTSKKITKTKKHLIETARDLFAKKGKDNVTMNEIATTSNKGRRTLYTYFRNKEEVYKTVVKFELSLIISELEENLKTKVSSYTKLKKHLITHLYSTKKVVQRNGTLRAAFFRDILEVERYRKELDNTERKIIKEILDEGIKKGEFIECNTDILSIITLNALKGLEVPYIINNISSDLEKNRNDIIDLVFKGIKK